MLEELSVYYHIILFQTEVFISDVFVPKSIIVIIVIYWLSMWCFLFNCLYLMNFSVRLSVKISHATLYLWLYLEITNCHFLFQDACSFFFAFVTFHASKHSFSDCHFTLLLTVHTSIKQLSNVLIFFHNLVIWFFTYLMRIDSVKLQLIHHLFA